MNDETKVKILTEEDLVNIEGGNDNDGKKTSGMPCPLCRAFIPITMYQIMSGSAVFCPACGLRLDIDKAKSEKAIEILKRLQEQQS